MHVHQRSHWLVKLILPLATLSFSVEGWLEAERAGLPPPPPSECHTWSGSELRDYRVEVVPNSFRVSLLGQVQAMLSLGYG